MNYSKEEYVKIFMKNIFASRRNKRRIKEDITQRIEASMEEDPFYNLYEQMGDPVEVAEEFMENLENSGGVSVVTIGISSSNKSYEYKSKTTIFGIPLVHVNVGGRFRTSVAKGIVAIGDVSIGVVAIGGVAFGLFTIGGIAIGALAIGGVAIGGVAIGGVAIGGIAIGAVAIGIIKVFGEILFLF